MSEVCDNCGDLDPDEYGVFRAVYKRGGKFDILEATTWLCLDCARLDGRVGR
jgi:hypothetical protein